MQNEIPTNAIPSSSGKYLADSEELARVKGVLHFYTQYLQFSENRKFVWVRAKPICPPKLLPEINTVCFNAGAQTGDYLSNSNRTHGRWRFPKKEFR